MVLSPIAADHVHSPRNAGKLDEATHLGVSGVPGDGPYVRLYFVVEAGKITKGSYQCNGCPSSTAAASVTIQLVIGRAIEQALLLEPQDLLTVLGGLPQGKGHYADLAVKALKDAFKEN